MTEIFIVYPIHLYNDISLLKELIQNNNLKTIFLIEDDIYFKKFNFHKQKILLHRSSMKAYYDFLLFELNIKNINIVYVDNHKSHKLYDSIKKNKNINIHLYDPIDHDLLNKVNKLGNVILYDNLSFMETYEDLLNYKETLSSNKYIHDNFYKWNRKRLNILLDKDKPLYGKWSFDFENRDPFDNKYTEIKPLIFKKETYLEEADKYVLKRFNENYGTYNIDNYLYPIVRQDALKQLNYFLKKKIATFGKYQDAVSKDILLGSHSNLSSSINIGLLTAEEVVSKTLKQFNKLSEKNKKNQIHNYEGFLRQIIGWRSYTRLLYEFHGNEMKTMNFFEHKRKLKNEWYTSTISFKILNPLINKVYNHAYLHHIERLMYIGNWFSLTQIDPKEVYKWFMIVSIDSYDWVMVSNIFGMSQHALDTSRVSMMTRPYFSSINYLKKMSDLVNNSDKEEQEIWNILYYYFIYNNIDYLKKNYATARSVKHWINKSDKEKKEIIKNAKNFL